jgi:putative transcriptional regulator
MHQDNLMQLLGSATAKYRLYAGFSGWAPRQLENEMHRNDWHILPADEASIFRDDMSGLWEELIAKATGPRALLTTD